MDAEAPTGEEDDDATDSCGVVVVPVALLAQPINKRNIYIYICVCVHTHIHTYFINIVMVGNTIHSLKAYD